MDERIFADRKPVLQAMPGGGLAMTGVKVMRLRNGMTLAVREDARFSHTLFRLEVKAGPAWEREDEAGISHLVEHMAFLVGADGRDIYSLIESSGGSVAATTSLDYTTFSLEMPSARWREGLASMHRLVFEMPLTQEAFEAERRIVAAELREEASDKGRIVFDSSLERLFAGTPYGRKIVGTEASLAGLTVDRVRDYVRRRYVPRDMVFSVVGNVEAEVLLEAADALFGGHPNDAPQAQASTVSCGGLPRGLSVEVVRRRLTGFVSGMAFPVPFVPPRLGAALCVLTELLDGSDSSLLKSRLCFGEAGAKGVRATYEAFEQAGLFLIEVFAEQENARACLRTLAQTLAGLDDSAFSDTQIRQACAKLADGCRQSLQKAETIAETISDENLHPRVGPEGWIPVPDFRDIGREQIRQAMELCLRPEAVAVTVIEDILSKAPAPDEEAIREILTEGWPALRGEKAAAPCQSVEPAVPEIVELGEGRSLALLPDASLPLVAVALRFSGGAALAEEQGLHGMDTLAAMFPSGMLARGRQETAAWLYERSATVRASRSVDGLCLHLSAPARFAADLFSLVEEAVSRPVFHEEDFERHSRTSYMSDERSIQAFQLVRSLLLRKGSYGRVCRPEDPHAQSLAGIAALWEAQCKRPWTLCVAGDFEREAVLAFARSLPVPSAPALDAGEPQWEEFGPFSARCDPSEQAFYALCLRSPGKSSPDRPAMELLMSCLNGGGGMLYRALRTKRQLCYSAEALDWCEAEAGLAGICLQTAGEQLDEAVDVLIDLLLRLQEEGPDDEELERGRTVALTAFHKSLERLEDRVFETVCQLEQGRGLDFHRRWREDILAVTADDVRKVAQRWFDLEQPAELSVEPEGVESGD